MTKVPTYVRQWQKAWENSSTRTKSKMIVCPTGAGNVENIFLPMKSGYNLVAVTFQYDVNYDNTCSTAHTWSDWLGQDLMEDCVLRRPSGDRRYNMRFQEAVKTTSILFSEEIINTETPNALETASAGEHVYESYTLPLPIHEGEGVHWMEIEQSDITGLLSNTDGVTINSITLNLTFHYSKVDQGVWSIETSTSNLPAGNGSINNDVAEGDTFLFMLSNQSNSVYDHVWPYFANTTNIDDVDWADPYQVSDKREGESVSQDSYERYWEEYHTFFPYQSDASCIFMNSIKNHPSIYEDSYFLTFSPECFYASRVSRMDIELVAGETSTHITQWMTDVVAKRDSEAEAAEQAIDVLPSPAKMTVQQKAKTDISKTKRNKNTTRKSFSIF